MKPDDAPNKLADAAQAGDDGKKGQLPPSSGRLRATSTLVAAGVVGALIGGGIKQLLQDPFQAVVDNDKQVSPDALAYEIAQKPDLQTRWKAMREFVRQVDSRVVGNRELDAYASKDRAELWKERDGIVDGHMESGSTDPNTRGAARYQDRVTRPEIGDDYEKPNIR